MNNSQINSLPFIIIMNHQHLLYPMTAAGLFINNAILKALRILYSKNRCKVLMKLYMHKKNFTRKAVMRVFLVTFILLNVCH